MDIFSRVMIFLCPCTSHAVSLALFIYACSGSAMPLLSCACLCNNSTIHSYPRSQQNLPGKFRKLDALRGVVSNHWTGLLDVD